VTLARRPPVPRPPRLLARETLPPEPRQRRSAEKRARIAAAALALFAERGYEATSMEAIAKRAGLAVGGVYLRFRSKRQLLLALMDDLVGELSRLDLRPAAGAGIRSGLRAILARAFAADLRYLGVYRAWQEAVLTDRGLAAHERALRAWTARRVAALFVRLRQFPGARRGVDPARLARVFDLFFWSVLPRLARMSTAERREWLDTATHIVYHAVFEDRRPDSE
jgi:AcrR family transcriptional regulator